MVRLGRSARAHNIWSSFPHFKCFRLVAPQEITEDLSNFQFRSIDIFRELVTDAFISRFKGETTLGDYSFRSKFKIGLRMKWMDVGPIWHSLPISIPMLQLIWICSSWHLNWSLFSSLFYLPPFVLFVCRVWTPRRIPSSQCNNECR